MSELSKKIVLMCMFYAGFILTAVTLYGLFAFYAADFDPRSWHWHLRAGYTWTTGIGGAIVGLCVSAWVDEAL